MGIVNKESKKDSSIIFKPDNLELVEKKTQIQRDKKKFKPKKATILNKPLLENISLSNRWRSTFSPWPFMTPYLWTISGVRGKKIPSKCQKPILSCFSSSFFELRFCFLDPLASVLAKMHWTLQFSFFLIPRWKMKFFMQIIALHLTVLGPCNGVADISLTSYGNN